MREIQASIGTTALEEAATVEVLASTRSSGSVGVEQVSHMPEEGQSGASLSHFQTSVIDAARMHARPSRAAAGCSAAPRTKKEIVGARSPRCSRLPEHAKAGRQAVSYVSLLPPCCCCCLSCRVARTDRTMPMQAVNVARTEGARGARASQVNAVREVAATSGVDDDDDDVCAASGALTMRPRFRAASATESTRLSRLPAAGRRVAVRSPRCLPEREA